MRKRTASIVINEDKWVFYLYGEEAYKAIISDDEEECAETDVEKRRISFRSSKFDLPTVIHEIFHAVWSYSNISSDMMTTTEDMEEVAAKVIEKNYLKILSKSVIIYNKLADKEQRIASTTTKKVQQICQSLSELGEKKQ